MTKEEKAIRKQFVDKIEVTVNDLQALCSRAKVPMFISLAYTDDEDGIYYDNRIVSASLEMPGYAKRINKLILAVNDCDVKLPKDIAECVSTLETWLENEGDYTSEDVTVDKFRKFLDIANGQVEAAIPQFFDEDVEEVYTSKKE